MLVVGQIPGAMPLAMLYMALGQKPPGALPTLGLRCLWPLAVGLFAKGDGQPINALVIFRLLFVPLSKPYTFCESNREDAEIAEAEV
jgi:hypothetical protein